MKIKDELERQREIEEMRTDSIYKPAALNTHDPHEMYAWANNKPWWLFPLQVLGFVAGGIGLTLCLYYATLILFLL